MQNRSLAADHSITSRLMRLTEPGIEKTDWTPLETGWNLTRTALESNGLLNTEAMANYSIYLSLLHCNCS
jgi:hypothetical protein